MVGVAPVLMALLQEHLPLAPLLGCCLPGVEARVERQGRLLPSLAADKGSGWTCIILPSGVLQQFSSSPFSAAKSFCSLCCWSPHRFGELPDSPLRRSAHTRCLSSCPESLPASLSPETFPGSPGQRQRRSRASRTCAAYGPVWSVDLNQH